MSDGTILVIDDQPDDIAVLSTALRGMYRVLAAHDADAARGVLRKGPAPDLVLMDVNMPGMNGFDFCRELKAAAATRDIPVLFVTSQDGFSDEEEGFAAGAVDYILKPVNRNLLIARVRTHVALSAARRDLLRQNEVLKENARLREEVEHVMRHDLKNPLTVIAMAGDAMARDAALPETTRALVDLLRKASLSMRELIDRSLDAYRLEFGGYVPKLDRLDALAVARAVKTSYQNVAAAGNVTVELLVDGAPPAESDSFWVLAEKPLLSSLLGNLVKNAVEASPAGETVTIDLRNADSPTISIHNRGAIPAEIRDRFFQKFTTAGKTGGTGLGAYSARLAACALGGDIAAQSSERDGTTITVRLRRAPARADKHPAP